MNTEQKYPVTLYNAEGLCSLSQEMNSHGFYVTFVLMAEWRLTAETGLLTPWPAYVWFIAESGTVTGAFPALQFSHISTIPPMLHTHSFTYHPHYIMFLSQVLQFSPVSTIPPTLHTHSFTYHPHYIMFLSQVLQFSPVSIIPPMLHTHSFTYHPHYIMFLSQYFSFHLSVSFHQCSIPIHSTTTHTI